MVNELKRNDKKLSFPLIQGGMGVGVSLSGLAGAVMKEGCMGVISAAHPGYRKETFRLDSIKANCDAIIEEVKKAKEIACGKGLLGINIMAASKDYIAYVKAAVKAKVDAIISGAGLPLDLPSYVDDESILLAPIVSSGKAARLICKIWDKRHHVTPDFIVIEGSEAGGHLGFKRDDLLDDTCESLEKIYADVKTELKPYQDKYQKDIPVFVAGGIYDGEDIAKYIKMGADGVQMGTRFIATNECDAALAFKQMVVDSTMENIEIVQSPTGFPGRGIMNSFMKRTKERGNVTIKKCLDCLTPCNPSDTPYCISEALIQAVQGNVENGLVFVGSNAHRVQEIVSVKHLIDELKLETHKWLGDKI
ncbi:nitronate monooxygenase [Breznakia sp. PF5-3]|uniref:NAD(P)H-dependent flavin oxidoreductase n=1 Tax=unclassified Breznakia TaxID=2623764 RepID=UPI0024064621|nr:MULTISPECIES: nitronate monooxygenase [unclassified Breznakia]MDL2276190.1 nitronate monooxygenase [Breznakia sp. OttesenSCG-928-G09]MDF9824711.1 nitronate monooxygenase [Breznakia sp. PM6-1]MDF9835374.1 nitronate monooxygenase [Breznakia sp. PF5-3]MDF9836973.1 nitronate monooxygenase [Breznakia sp. PFB2-8]MDF9859609.1 nitronate monooxygenase [Breznakia sp. PH5-24]